MLYSEGKNDEMYTPNYAVLPILEYIKKDWVVWCPFDTKDSEFVKEISKTNKVIYSHIEYNQDFYEYEPSEHWDCIISNPPFTNKRHIFERALSFNKPIALLMSNTWLNDKYSKWYFMKVKEIWSYLCSIKGLNIWTRKATLKIKSLLVVVTIVVIFYQKI